jgi:hypothetical protein
MQLTVPLERRGPVRADFDHGHLVQFPAIILGVGFQDLND